MRLFFALILFISSLPCLAQQKQKAKDPLYRTHGGSTENRPIAIQRTAVSTGIPKVLNRIPAKNYEIMLEIYDDDPESLNLKEDIKNFLRNKGYTNVKTNVQSYYGEDFKFRQCDVAILNDSGSFVLFIPPCDKAYKNP